MYEALLNASMDDRYIVPGSAGMNGFVKGIAPLADGVAKTVQQQQLNLDNYYNNKISEAEKLLKMGYSSTIVNQYLAAALGANQKDIAKQEAPFLNVLGVNSVKKPGYVDAMQQAAASFKPKTGATGTATPTQTAPAAATAGSVTPHTTPTTTNQTPATPVTPAAPVTTQTTTDKTAAAAELAALQREQANAVLRDPQTQYRMDAREAELKKIVYGQPDVAVASTQAATSTTPDAPTYDPSGSSRIAQMYAEIDAMLGDQGALGSKITDEQAFNMRAKVAEIERHQSETALKQEERKFKQEEMVINRKKALMEPLEKALGHAYGGLGKTSGDIEVLRATLAGYLTMAGYSPEYIAKATNFGESIGTHKYRNIDIPAHNMQMQLGQSTLAKDQSSMAKDAMAIKADEALIQQRGVATALDLQRIIGVDTTGGPPQTDAGAHNAMANLSVVSGKAAIQLQRDFGKEYDDIVAAEKTSLEKQYKETPLPDPRSPDPNNPVMIPTTDPRHAKIIDEMAVQIGGRKALGTYNTQVNPMSALAANPDVTYGEYNARYKAQFMEKQQRELGIALNQMTSGSSLMNMSQAEILARVGTLAQVNEPLATKLLVNVIEPVVQLKKVEAAFKPFKARIDDTVNLFTLPSQAQTTIHAILSADPSARVAPSADGTSLNFEGSVVQLQALQNKLRDTKGIKLLFAQDGSGVLYLPLTQSNPTQGQGQAAPAAADVNYDQAAQDLDPRNKK